MAEWKRHAYALLRGGIHAMGLPPGQAKELVKLLRAQVRKVIGPIATPDRIQIVPGLPKTRSGKIMRRILRKVAAGEYDDLGDISNLADPSVVDAIVAAHKAQAD